MITYVLTGGPCTGKTLLLEVLASRGHHTIPEVARPFIESEEQKKILDPTYEPILPDKNNALFQYHITLLQEQSQQELVQKLQQIHHTKPPIIGSDRGLPDNEGYEIAYKTPVDEVTKRRIQKARYDIVFLLERLPYVQDSVRRESTEFAAHIHACIESAYKKYNHNIIEVPRLSADKNTSLQLRADLIEQKIEEYVRKQREADRPSPRTPQYLYK